MHITNNLQNYNNFQNKSNVKYQHIPLSFTGIKPVEKSQKATGIGIGAGILGLAGLIGIKSKPIKRFVSKEIIRPLERKIFKDRNFLRETDGLEGVDLEKDFNKMFMEDFVDRIKHPFRKYRMQDGTIEERLENFPPNGYMLTGPDSKSKEERFNWMLNEMEKAGATIIDPGKGKKAKFDTVGDAWWDMWNNHSDEEFKKTGKFKVFVVRGVDELGQPKGYPEGHLKYPDGALLKDSPDTDSCIHKHGIMLFYTCRSAGRLDPATIRTGRIDVKFSPQPKDDEPIEIWKEYLEDLKRYMPPVVVNKLEAAKQVLSKRGEKVMKEMEPHFEYMVPYESPKVTDSLNKWQDYVNKQSENPNMSKSNEYFRNDIKKLQGNLYPLDPDKFNKILKMMEDVQTPEYKDTWKFIVKCTMEGQDPAYYL